jgi:hypothetical protein
MVKTSMGIGKCDRQWALIDMDDMQSHLANGKLYAGHLVGLRFGRGASAV